MENLFVMFGKNVSEREKSLLLVVSAAIYAAAVLLYFLPVDIPYKISVPTVVIAAVSLRILPWQMSFALIASALGDISGAAGSFMGKIEFFSVAHLFLIIFFVHRWFHDRAAFARAGGHHPETKPARIIVLAAIVLGILVFAMVRIVPDAPEGIIRGAVAMYAVIICMMFFCALVQRSRVYAAAAFLFVFSDAVIGWNAFVGHVCGEKYMIMIPYYAAQLMFFLRAAHSNVCGFLKKK